MHWALFNQVLVKVAGTSELDPVRDAAAYADQLLAVHPYLFAALDGQTDGVEARMAARTIAQDHLREVCDLRRRVEQLQTSMANSEISACERLVRTASLAYLASDGDLISDDLPHGLGLVDDCMLLRGARVATPGVMGVDYFVEDLLAIQYLSVAVPEALLAAVQRALAYFAALWQRTRHLPESVVELALVELMQSPPPAFPSTLRLPPPSTPDWQSVEPPLILCRGQLIVADAGRLEISFPDGVRLERARDGALGFL